MALLPGLKLITPTLVTYTGSGSGSVDANGTITYSDAPTVRVNGVFTSSFNNYYIALETNFTSTGYVDLFLQMMKSGIPNINTTYYSQYIDANSTSVTGSRTTAANRATIGVASSSEPSFTDLYIFSPFNSSTSTCFIANGVNGYGSIYMRDYVGTVSDVETNDGFVISVDPGTISGTIHVYGFNK